MPRAVLLISGFDKCSSLMRSYLINARMPHTRCLISLEFKFSNTACAWKQSDCASDAYTAGNLISRTLLSIGASPIESTALSNYESWRPATSHLGNVVIGTTSPAARLDFGGNPNGTQILNFYNNGAGARIGFGINSNENQFYMVSSNHVSFNSGGDLQTSGTNEIMRIMGTGNVGIGTTSPGSNLPAGGDRRRRRSQNPPLAGGLRQAHAAAGEVRAEPPVRERSAQSPR